MKDTPRTNDIIEQVKGFRTPYAIYSLEQFSRELERELTTATEQLTKAHETIGTMIDEIGMLQLKDKATTEQLDRLAAAALRIMADGTSCRECGGEDQAFLAREALQSLDQNDERMDG
jgi:hypothetical protein